ncbi:hypothetical protein FACS1894110_15740 [Spirochaetia bacterium]|nr:hypothetical protein FACS1894110_15740 [Spirochaetia bacterium]
MNKQYFFRGFVVFFAFLGLYIPLFAEAPELQYVMPNSWKKITRLSTSEEIVFLQKSESVLQRIVENAYFGGTFLLEEKIRETTRVYRQRAGNEVFYRLITTETKTPDFSDSRNIVFFQSFLHSRNEENILLCMAPYNSVVASQWARFQVFGSIDIIEGTGKVKGILATDICVSEGEKYGSLAIIKDQAAGSSSAVYLPWKDASLISNETELPYYSWSSYHYFEEVHSYIWIKIEASDCLVDEKIPLRYGLQNAFDGDPATSYVENTEDDLMQITFSTSLVIGRFAVKNGYALDRTLYSKNNRIKEIVLFKVDLARMNEQYNITKTAKILSDNTLGYQIIETDGVFANLSVTDLYKGTNYNDTCIAEFNLYTTEYGWLFGDINE